MGHLKKERKFLRKLKKHDRDHSRKHSGRKHSGRKHSERKHKDHHKEHRGNYGYNYYPVGPFYSAPRAGGCSACAGTI